MRIQVLGICRFSLLVESDFQTTGADLDRNRAILYNPARMNQRMAWFENLCLPPLRAQSDPDFTLVVATGADLPDPWITRLRDIAASVPQIKLMHSVPGRHAPICKAMLAAATEPGANIVAQFRMDDDDAVAVDYVQRVRDDFQLVAPLVKGAGHAAINYLHGLVLTDGPKDLTLTEELARLWGTGLTMYFPGGTPRSIMNYRHDHMWRLAPVVSLPGPCMWLRGFHDANDSIHRPAHNRAPVAGPAGDLPRVLSDRFGLDLAALRGALRQGSGAAVPSRA